jgi:hypothetical protein
LKELVNSILNAAQGRKDESYMRIIKTQALIIYRKLGFPNTGLVLKVILVSETSSLATWKKT